MKFFFFFSVQQAAMDIEAKEKEMKARSLELQQRLSAMQDANQREYLERRRQSNGVYFACSKSKTLT